MEGCKAVGTAVRAEPCRAEPIRRAGAFSDTRLSHRQSAELGGPAN